MKDPHDNFATFEHDYLLRYVQFSNFRGGVLFSGLFLSIGFYISHAKPPAVPWGVHEYVSCIGVVMMAIATLLAGIAFCPIPRKISKFTRFTHYLDIAKYPDGNLYAKEVMSCDERQITREKILQCYELGVTVKQNMELLAWAISIGGAGIFLTYMDLFLFKR